MRKKPGGSTKHILTNQGVISVSFLNISAKCNLFPSLSSYLWVKHISLDSILIYDPNLEWNFALHHCNVVILYLSPLPCGDRDLHVVLKEQISWEEMMKSQNPCLIFKVLSGKMSSRAEVHMVSWCLISFMH